MEKLFSNISEKGISVYFALLIMVILLSAALGLSTILYKQIRMTKGIGDSVIAFYAADTGMERALKEEIEVSGTLENGASYQVQKISPGGDCIASYYCLKSVGRFNETRRAIETSR